MAAPVKSSRWGSFLQQAVAGVEARLDNILAEGENGISSAQPDAAQSATVSIRDQHPLNGISRSSTSSRTNDRLQERLAKAMASKTVQQSDARSISSDSRSARPSTDVAAIAAETPRSPVLTSSKTSYSQCSEANESTNVASELPRPSVGSETHQSECFQCHTFQGHIAVLEGSLEQTKREQQEETHRYVEQFEALQAKLQFLARDATDAARKSAASAPTGSFDQKLAERDEKIAVLLEEGRKLAATEQKHRSIIRKLRSQLSNIEKELAEARARLEKATADLETLRPRATRSEELEQSTNDLQIRLNGARDEMNALRANVAANTSTIQQLRDGLAKARDQASLAATKASEESLNLEKRRIKDLEDTVAALALDKNLVAERAKITIAEAEERAKIAADRLRVAELEMRAELQSMESKLEAMRALAEEASSGAISDSQIKILRQVETLQTQHAIATDNWQGIEASLLTRVDNLERERDDALRRESEMRKKARETATRCKRQDEELQELTSKFPHYQNDIEAYQSQIGTLSQPGSLESGESWFGAQALA
ncbi:hypothetical protein Cob_v007376 [Colletotrichum orbiculare MAFF 240422]|uniref:M protein repeat protein n=1 Tax=Colletotrichum orbiculare (strain 104-T / ATCC 96160 / CBS 514.97 / LARS 414 / MAFF 240422) TaxID=1213857 RepID=A0A484FP65_COLOR|nr:hypothetical protein Cob_v007376 [Colletotrichum orbiculare MAFF 240422]